jgi:predicted phosphodiesterase
VRLALIADCHAGPDDETGHWSLGPALLGALVHRLNSRVVPDLVVDLGDRVNATNRAIDLASLAAVGAALSRSNAPVVRLDGNEDRINLTAEDHDLALGRATRAGAFERDGWRMVFLDTVANGRNRISDEALADLRLNLTCGRGSVVLVSHQPLVAPDLQGSRYFCGPGRGALAVPENAADAIEIINSSGRVALAIAGHVHSTSVHEAGGTAWVTLQSLSEWLPEHHVPAETWADLVLEPGGFRVEIHDQDMVCAESHAT